jgi:hypothetical protein
MDVDSQCNTGESKLETLDARDERRRRRARKLQAVVDTMKRERFSFAQFLSAWVEADEGKGIILQHRLYSRVKQRRKALLKAVTEDSQLSGVLGAPADLFTKELDCLIKEPHFATVDTTSKLEDIDFTAAFRTIQDTAPAWYTTLLQMLSNQRGHRASYGGANITAGERSVLVKRAYAITSMICSSRAKKRSNFFITLVDIYLIGSGVKRRVFETLSGFGICHSYKQANRVMATIAEEAQVCYSCTLLHTPRDSCTLLGQLERG